MPKPQQNNKLTIIGMSDYGWGSIGELARHYIKQAEIIIGGQRHLNFLPPDLTQGKSLETWPSPLKPYLDNFAKSYQDNAAPRPQTCILASGNPMLYGIGATLAKSIPAHTMTILPNVSVQSQICAVMAWPEQETQLISLCGRPISQINRHLFNQNRLIVLSNDENSPLQVAQLLCQQGFASSEITLFQNIGGQTEDITAFSAQSLMQKPDLAKNKPFSALNAMAITLQASSTAVLYSTAPGLPDVAFLHDGQITKQDIRALTVSTLSPRPNAILWDIGSGSGSISIEWMRAAPRALAYAIEPRPERITNIKQNAQSLGTPTLKVIEGKAPQALNSLSPPDAIFIGGGLTQNDDLIALCLKNLKAGGRLVINAVTLQSEALLFDAYKEFGGTLTQIQISKPDKIGKFDSWKPARPVTQWCYIKPYITPEITPTGL